jgi:predicted nucleotidyltransferase
MNVQTQSGGILVPIHKLTRSFCTHVNGERMHPHHLESIQRVTEYFQRDPEVLALLLGGSIAHGFETPSSDIDILIFVSDEDYKKRFAENRIHFFHTELASYDGGYVDGKYSTHSFVKQVIETGSEPARFAFAGSRVLFSKMNGFDADVRKAAQYPKADQAERIKRFYAQFEAWHWYCGEALRLKNLYLLGASVGKFILFSGRLVLAHNELLYPYHKWFLKVLERAQDKPNGLLECIRALNENPIQENIESLYEMVKGFRPWIEGGLDWPTQFMLDSELNWLEGNTPVDDL